MKNTTTDGKYVLLCGCEGDDKCDAHIMMNREQYEFFRRHLLLIEETKRIIEQDKKRFR